MEFLLGIVIMGIAIAIYSVVFSMIILSAFFGIPQTKKLKKEGILLPSAKIGIYFFTITIWLVISIISITSLYAFLPKRLFTYVFVGLVVALFNSFKSLSKSNYSDNMSDLLHQQRENIDNEKLNKWLNN